MVDDFLRDHGLDVRTGTGPLARRDQSTGLLLAGITIRWAPCSTACQPVTHLIWHLFVMVGTAFIYFSILFYV